MLAGIIIFGIFFFALVYFGQRFILFPSPKTPHSHGSVTVPMSGERMWIDQPSGRTEAWLFCDRTQTGQPLVLYFHGNAEIIDFAMDKVSGYRRLGYGVAVMEYRGYGRSDGSPSQRNIVADATSLIQKLADDTAFDMNHLIFHGRSLGGGVAAALARIHPARQLVLESTFTSITSMARGMGIPSIMVRDPFNTIEFLSDFQGGVLVLHGVHDTVVPVEHAYQLATAARHAKHILMACGHNDCPSDVEAYWSGIKAFLSHDLSGTAQDD